MQLTKLSVPGKVMLSGEYAVLYGAVSVLAPVTRCIELTEINTPLGEAYTPVVKTAIHHPIREILDYEQANGLPHIEVDSSQFFYQGENDRNIKLGLGCSAAEAVGVISLRFDRAGKRIAGYRDAILGHALQAHSQAQSGLGSGADVAACAYGRPISFRTTGNDFRLDVIEISQTSPQIPMNLIWTGQPADTRKMVGQFQNWVDYGGTKAR
ncbi:MAG: hypothetical protein GY839_06945, partial [candidate division Zixibacteria bacterium]|nr:hypothetical protein [candidate division Zixibacteria bacterium]